MRSEYAISKRILELENDLESAARAAICQEPTQRELYEKRADHLDVTIRTLRWVIKDEGFVV